MKVKPSVETNDFICIISSKPLNTNEGERNMKLTKFEVSNILDALEEWFVNVTPKELSEKDIGLDDYRYSLIHRKLTTFIEEKKNETI